MKCPRCMGDGDIATTIYRSRMPPFPAIDTCDACKGSGVICDGCGEAAEPGYQWCNRCRFSDPHVCPWCDGDKRSYDPCCDDPECGRKMTGEVVG